MVSLPTLTHPSCPSFKLFSTVPGRAKARCTIFPLESPPHPLSLFAPRKLSLRTSRGLVHIFSSIPNLPFPGLHPFRRHPPPMCFLPFSCPRRGSYLDISSLSDPLARREGAGALSHRVVGRIPFGVGLFPYVQRAVTCKPTKVTPDALLACSAGRCWGVKVTCVYCPRLFTKLLWGRVCLLYFLQHGSLSSCRIKTVFHPTPHFNPSSHLCVFLRYTFFGPLCIAGFMTLQVTALTLVCAA